MSYIGDRYVITYLGLGEHWTQSFCGRDANFHIILSEANSVGLGLGHGLGPGTAESWVRTWTPSPTTTMTRGWVGLDVWGQRPLSIGRIGKRNNKPENFVLDRSPFVGRWSPIHRIAVRPSDWIDCIPLSHSFSFLFNQLLNKLIFKYIFRIDLFQIWFQRAPSQSVMFQKILTIWQISNIQPI
jgi:hypothetical protein